MCFIYFLDLCYDSCVEDATCEGGNCVCITGDQGNGYVSCTIGNVLHILVIRLFSIILNRNLYFTTDVLVANML